MPYRLVRKLLLNRSYPLVEYFCSVFCVLLSSAERAVYLSITLYDIGHAVKSAVKYMVQDFFKSAKYAGE